MIQLACISNYLNLIKSILIIIAIIVGIVVFMKFEGSRKILYYLACTICIVSGCISTGKIIESRKSTNSYIYGDIVYEVESKKAITTINLDTLNLYEGQNNEYYYMEELAAVDFDGTKDDYLIYVNGVASREQKLQAGIIEGYREMKFKNTAGEVTACVKLKIKFEFLSSKTKFTITVEKVEDNLTYLNQDVTENGLNISVQYTDKVIESIKGEINE